MAHSEPEWITTSKAAALTGYSLNYIRRLVREKRVPATKWQRDWMVDRQQLLAYQQEMTDLGRAKHNPHREPASEPTPVVVSAPPLPDPTELMAVLGLELPVIGVYDAPDPASFAPLVEPQPGVRACVFSFFQAWRAGQTLHLTRDNTGCGGASHWLWNTPTRSREEFVKFLVDAEGLKADHALMHQWLEASRPYQPTCEHLLIGPLRAGQEAYLKTLTLYVNPDQLSLLLTGAQYHAAPSDPAPAIAPFGSGCMQLLPLFADLTVPQAIIGGTDIAMRQYLPPDVLAFTVTPLLWARLCALDERSFLYKPFRARLQQARRVAERG